MNSSHWLSLGLFCLLSWSVGHAQDEQESGGFGDWDWGAIEALDDTPVTGQSAVVRKTDTSRRLTVEEVTAPNFDAEPHEAYSLFTGMPKVAVIPSVKDSEIYPCVNCHRAVQSNPKARKLDQPHNNFELRHGLHGRGEFWCFTCHNDDNNPEQLKTLNGEIVDFDDAYIICSQCHVDQARDWAYGAHGKRHVNWSGERQIYNCTACHYQHSPKIPSREAMPGPSMRMALERPQHWQPQEVEHSQLHGRKQPWQEEHGGQHE